MSMPAAEVAREIFRIGRDPLLARARASRGRRNVEDGEAAA